MKRLKLGIIGGGPGSWIGHVHRIASRFDDKYEIVAGVFSRNYKINQSFGTSIGIKKNRCYKNYKDLCYSEKKINNGIDVVAIMTPPGSHQEIAELFINNNIHVISDKPFAGSLPQAKKLYKTIKNNKKIIIAYEPVWSIGTGIIPKSDDLFKTISFIKKEKKNYKVLYGGSVNPKNINQLKSINNIDGYLIGGASQDPKKFIDIIKKTYN